MTFLWSAQNRLFIDLGSSPGFPGRFPEHFAALPRKRQTMTRRAESSRSESNIAPVVVSRPRASANIYEK